ncbi:MAG: T9SS type A sorting domain-containing protein, partial [Saprospiraceae bacterium]|nr:T9SS type A sorting domain-containing protein [Saprospiraceae bacterium]
VDIYLPVELLSFEANRLTADEVQLSWATASETNNKGFYIERMLENETEFSTVAWQDGNGTTTNTSYYGINDPNAYSGISYYRLKQVDTDESFNYSIIRTVAGQEGSLASFTNLNIYPNPVENNLKIRFGALPKQINEAQIKIIAIDGRILYEFTATIEAYQVLEIDYIKNLIPAMYILSVDMEGNQRVMKKFIKKE